MNPSELLEMGAALFQKSNLSGEAGSNLELSSISGALSELTGGAGLDLGALVTSITAGGLGDIVQSWLGDGVNSQISPEAVSAVLGSEKVAGFASQLGISVEEAAGGLSEALPQMIDKGSSGGSLLDSFGGVEGILGLAGKLFSK